MSTRLSAIDFTPDLEKLTKDFTGRQWVFDDIDRWLKESEERFFILTGEPGVGKSAIAARLTQLRQDIAAYHFCIAGRSGTIEPNNVLLSLAAQLIDYFPDYAEALANTIKPLRLSVNVEITIETIKDSEVRGVVINNLHTQNPQEALNVVLRRSLAALPHPPQQPVLLLIDSLDEAVTLRGDNNLVTLLAEANDLPPWVRFVFTTRSERRVLRYFERLKPYTLAAESQMNLDDIRQYIENRVGKEKMQARLQSAKVEPQTFVNRLTELSTGNFLYTKILLNDIEAGQQSLDDLSALPRSLDEIYHGFLKRFTVTEWEERYQPILGILAVAQEPITEVQLAHFTGIGQGKIRQNLGVVCQFLDISDDGHGRETFSVFHQSLRDYLLNEQRNIDFWCEAKEQHQRLVDYYMADDQSWHTKPTSDRYLWHHLAYHLSGASKTSELRALLFNFDWLQAKLDATDANALIADYDFLPDALGLSLVQSAIRLSAHILVQDKKQLKGQLFNRLLSYEVPEIQTMLEQAKQWKAVAWLRPLTPSLTSPTGKLLRTLTAEAQVYAVAVTPDGKQVIAGSMYGTLKVWNIQTGEELFTLNAHSDSVTTLALTPDGKRLISGSLDKTIKVWSLERKEELSILKGHSEAVQAVAITADGKRIISASLDRKLKVWNLETGEELFTLIGHLLRVNAVAVTPDDRLVISGSYDRTLKVWNLETGKELFTLIGHRSVVNAVVVTPDGKRVISGSWDKTIKIWDIDTGKGVFRFIKNFIPRQELFSLDGHSHSVEAVAVTSDVNRIISASRDGTLKVWNLSTKKEIFSLIGHSESVNAVTVTADGKRIISASDDETVKVWNLETDEAVFSLTSHTNRVKALVLTPDGKQVISGSDDTTLKVWNLETFEEVFSLIGHTYWLTALAVTPDGKQVISAALDKTLKVWNLETGEELFNFTSHNFPVNALAVTPDGKRVISGSSDKTLKVWNLETGEEIFTFIGHSFSVSAVAVTPDGRRAISGSSDKTLKVWNLETGEKLFTLEGHTNTVDAVALTPDGKQIISGSGDRTLKVWDVETGKQLFTLVGHTMPVTAVMVTKDGKRVISSSNDHTLNVWNLETGEKLFTLMGHSDLVQAVGVTPDDKKVISVSIDKTLKVWDLSSGELIDTFTGEGALWCCAVAPDGVTIIAGEASGRVHFLRLEGV
jgi:WD40 repeat protein